MVENKTILKNKFIIFLMIVAFIQPDYLRSINLITMLYIGLLFLVCFLFFVYMVQNKMKIKTDRLIVLLFIYSFYTVAVTVITGGRVFNAFRFFLFSLLLCLIYNELLRNEKESFIKIGSIIFEIFLYANLVITLMFPDGIYETYRLVFDSSGNFFLRLNRNAHFLLGHRNNVVYFILTALAFSFTDSYLSRNKVGIRTILLFLISWITVIATWSANSIVAMLMISICLIIANTKLSRLINPYTGFIFSIAFFFGIIILRLQRVFSWFIEGLLNKSLTLTGREALWDNTINSIKNNPIFGHGDNDNFQRLIDIGHMNSAHNIYLDLLYKGGIVQLVLFLIIMFHVMKKIKIHSDIYIYKVFSSLFLGYFVVLSATPLSDFHFSLFLVFLIICNNIEILRKKS